MSSRTNPSGELGSLAPEAEGVDNPLFAEKVREDAIRDEHFEVVRVVWSQLDAPGDIRRRIDAAVARSARRAA